jgi:pyruvate/2-oxoglutarate dehydrogenase complex dihydrolipoamide dehydrogenase (E3) component
MRLVVDADTLEILGAAILHVRGDESIQSILDVMDANAPLREPTRTRARE